MPVSAEPVRVFLVDDHAIVRAGVRAMLGTAPDVLIVGEANSGVEAVSLAAQLAPDVVVMDLEMPGGDGEAATRELRALAKPPRVLILTMHEERNRLLPLLSAGASGYLAKDATRSDLVDAIRVIASGDAYVRPVIARRLASRAADRPASQERGNARASYDSLSQRERAVLRLIADGLNGSEIAKRLGISTKTVNTYKRRIQAKIGLDNRAAYVRFALEAHLLEG
jgi:two-component system response regulator NreC